MVDLKALKRFILEICSDQELWEKDQIEWGRRDAKKGTPPVQFDEPYYSAYTEECAKVLRED